MELLCIIIYEKKEWNNAHHIHVKGLKKGTKEL